MGIEPPLYGSRKVQFAHFPADGHKMRVDNNGPENGCKDTPCASTGTLHGRMRVAYIVSLLVHFFASTGIASASTLAWGPDWFGPYVIRVRSIVSVVAAPYKRRLCSSDRNDRHTQRVIGRTVLVEVVRMNNRDSPAFTTVFVQALPHPCSTTLDDSKRA